MRILKSDFVSGKKFPEIKADEDFPLFNIVDECAINSTQISKNY